MSEAKRVRSSRPVATKTRVPTDVRHEKAGANPGSFARYKARDDGRERIASTNACSVNIPQ